jgi:DNA mismatch repair protein MutS2
VTDSRSQTLLEFPEIRARLAALTAFAPSRRLVEQLEPSTDPVVVARQLDETDQLREVLAERSSVGIGGARDIAPWIGRAARGGRLEVDALTEILATLVAASRLKDALGEERRPLVRDLGQRVQPLPVLRNRLELSVDPNGELLDSASPALGGLRRAVRSRTSGCARGWSSSSTAPR